MIKKILLICSFFMFSIAFSQEKSIEKLIAAPNPFSNSTVISFDANSESKSTFTVKNILGKVVSQRTIQTMKGNNSFPFLKGDLTSGIYIYTIQNKENTISKRLVIQ
ncbi:MAG: T9SS type A sorting domain-containing protein [Flavobacteriia bacterium]|nr:T9SS type A sorting domain-containing protein [Flavobacteriia bacterium]OIP48372.1 MAG: hypothetical protein AUK46_01830 [Flavobacteriaceae bacterium CG2_30_31_66]PIV96321.1 MAG: hypothetical protein COW43_09235 [Flavobacteriaceae bacterium CG17_big_fil_post_rev_8_21_14_2_50_31_13]PIY13579.1 MAG: hypothetical protein COZ16_13790 [Flavobacteriaceae bacterium CG_4_10_14_3_um_filter_31_253]PIZ09457.1 MAG: hypothetical protein COY55_12865 [Flavobacteriaceae bacterium CG_4_10_14_0_8_um_filter_31_